MRRLVIVNKEPINPLIRTRYILSLFSSFIAVFIFYFMYKNSEQYIQFFIILTIYRMIENLSDFSYGLFQKDNSERFILFSKIFRLVLFLLLIVLLYLYDLNISYFSILLLISSIIPFFYIDMKSLKSFKEMNGYLEINTYEIFSVIRNNWQLGASSSLVSLITNIPVYAIEYLLGTSSVGVYSSIRYIITGLSTVANSIGFVLLKHVSNISNEKNKLIYFTIKIELITLFIGIFLIILSNIFHQQIITILFSNNIIDYSYLLPLMILAGVIFTMVSFLSDILLSINVKKELMTIRLEKLFLLTIILGLYSIFSEVNLAGIVICTIVSNIFEIIYMTIILYNRIKIKPIN